MIIVNKQEEEEEEQEKMKEKERNCLARTIKGSHVAEVQVHFH